MRSLSCFLAGPRFPESIFDKEQSGNASMPIAPHGILCCMSMQAVGVPRMDTVAFSACHPAQFFCSVFSL